MDRVRLEDSEQEEWAATADIEQEQHPQSNRGKLRETAGCASSLPLFRMTGDPNPALFGRVER
jgi:hypothetical protein